MFNNTQSISSSEQTSIVKRKKDEQEHNQNTVKAAWILFEAIRQNMNVGKNDLLGMQSVVRAFCIEIATQQTSKEEIIAGGQTLIKFPTDKFPSKESYLRYHARDGVWGEDALLFQALEALGYQPIMHLNNTDLPPYVPFVQQCSENPMRCDIVNYNAQQQGSHWELKDQTNPGSGNCMYYTVAQKVQQDYEVVQSKIDLDEVLYVKENLKDHKTVAFVQPQIKVQENNAVTTKVEAEFFQKEKIVSEARRQKAMEMLVNYSTQELVQLYQSAMKKSDYLPGRLKEIEAEWKITSEQNPVRQAIERNSIDLNLEPTIREQLLHALSIEAWKNQGHYDALVTISSSKNTPCSQEVESELKDLAHTPQSWKTHTLVM